MFLKSLRIRVLMAVILEVVVVDNGFLRPISLKNSGKRTFSNNEKNNAQARDRNETSKTNSYIETQSQFITDGGIPCIAPDFHQSFNTSTIATVSLINPSCISLIRTKIKLTKNLFLLLFIDCNQSKIR